jgi:SAM-dependent methyltransferase
MDVLPEEVAARRERLERWVGEQQRRRDQDPAPVPLRTRVGRAMTEGRRVARGWSEWLGDRVVNRGLDISAHAIEPEHDHPDRVRYVPSSWHHLPRALYHLGVSDRDTFIDFGCGKGGVVQQAARRPFRRVIGVEISPVLAEIARTNLAARRRQHRCRSVEIVVSDVKEFSVPDDLTIGYLFHPFLDETLDAVLQSIVDSMTATRDGSG